MNKWSLIKTWLSENEPSAYFTIFLICSVIMFLPEAYQASLTCLMKNFAYGSPTVRDLMTLITYQFAHSNWDHILGNFTFATPAAIFVENRIGRSEFVKLWLWSGICAALGFMLMGMATPRILGMIIKDVPVGLIGASGSISGIFTWACLKFGEDCWWKKILGYTGWTLFFAGQCLMMGESVIWGGGIAYAGHVFGAVGCLLYMATRKRD